ncbi:PadR family transcriptional regulator [Georgenia soli]|uniref:PadR family transcriptional regulator n=1 Tax=Georgenia soli TaxID=638953 RepID=A0A2A9ELG3_9MICO|nr:PadR family transcriptional regulator [Georgenia soli]
MSARTRVLELAILGRLREAPMHGYELRKHLNAALGAFRTLSYGSLYPALRSLTERGLITAAEPASAPLGGRRARIVYELTDAGRDHLEEALATAEPASWDDDSFDVRFTLFGSTDATTRLRILEGRRARMVERQERLRQSLGRTSRRMDSYTAELARHGLEQVEREVQWLERVIDTERGTRGALDYRALPADGPEPAGIAPGGRGPVGIPPHADDRESVGTPPPGTHIPGRNGTPAVADRNGGSAVVHETRGGGADGATAFPDVPQPTKEQA